MGHRRAMTIGLLACGLLATSAWAQSAVGAGGLVYLMGGEHEPLDVLEYPTLGKRYLLISTPNGTEFYELNDPSKPFGPA